MDISELSFLESNLNAFGDAFINHLLQMKDESGTQNVFLGGGYGIKLPMESPEEITMPDFRLWYETQTFEQLAQQVYFGTTTATVELFIHIYARERFAEVQQQRQRLVEHVLRKIQHNDAPDSFKPDYGKYQIPQQQFRIDNTNAYKRHGDNILVIPPDFVTLVEFDVEYYIN